MAEPWSNDFQALADHTKQGLRPLLAPQPEETQKMRFFKTHPALAALVMFVGLALVGGAAYAVVREVFITIDPDKPADQIEKDVHDQLEAAGVPSTVHAEKQDDGKLKIRIGSVGKDVGSDLQIHVNGVTGPEHSLRMKIEAKKEMTAEQSERLTTIASSQAIIDLVTDRGDQSDADVAAAVQKIFTDAGVDVTVSVADGELTISVN